VAAVQYTFTHKQYTERHTNFGSVLAVPRLGIHATRIVFSVSGGTKVGLGDQDGNGNE